MHATYNSWLVTLSIVLAITVAYTALKLAGRVAEQEGSGGRLWLLCGAAAMGIGIWSMHFIGMLAFSVPIPLRYSILTTLASLLIAILTSAFALSITSRRDLSLGRLALGSVVMGAGICAMHYTGMAAIQIVPTISYDPLLVAASIVIAVTASCAALWLAFRLRSGNSWMTKLARAVAALVMGLAISGMHYTAMAASMLAPGSYCLGGAALDNGWLAFTIGLIALGLLAITLITAVYDAHLESRARQDARRLAELNADLQHGKNLLTLATQSAGIVCWEFDVTTGKTLWTENEIDSLRAAGIDVSANPQALLGMIHANDAAAAVATIRAAVEDRRDGFALRARVVPAPGKIVHLQGHARMIYNDRGQLERLLGVCWDISDSVEQEERREQLQVQLRHVSRQAGMAEVATGVLHNVGNVLNSLGICAAMLQSGLRDSRLGNVKRIAQLLIEHGDALGTFLQNDPRGREIPSYLAQLGEHLSIVNQKLSAEAQAVVTHVEHIGKIVAAQQTYARRGGIEEQVDVAELVDNAITLNFAVGTEVVIARQYEAVARVTLDRHKLIQILTNLLSNACHALRDKPLGQRSLIVRIRALKPEWLAIEIEDSGIGMDSDAMRHLFEFGFTTKKDGHGFGLHACAILAKEMGGETSGHSDGPGLGARFTVRLPLRAAGELEERRRA